MRTPLIILFFFLNFYFFKNDILPSLDSLLDGPKFNPISYEKLLQDSQAKLTRVLLGISHQTETFQMTIETLLKLVEKGLLDDYQVITVWRYLAKKAGDEEGRKEEEIRRMRECQRKEEEEIRMKEEEWIRRRAEEGIRKKEKEGKKKEEEEWKTREIEGMRRREEEKIRKWEEEGRRRRVEEDRRNSEMKKQEEKKEEERIEKKKLEDDNRRSKEENGGKTMDAGREESEKKIIVNEGRDEMKKVEEQKNIKKIKKETQTEKEDANKTEELLENKSNTNEQNEKNNLSNITNNPSIFQFEKKNETTIPPPASNFPASSFSSFPISSQPSLPLVFGYFFLMFFILLISLSLYKRGRHIILLVLLSFLLYNLFYLMISLQIENHIITIPGLIALNMVLVFNFCIHLILIKLGLQKKFNSWKDIFLPHNSVSNLSLSSYSSPSASLPNSYPPSFSFFCGREGFLIQSLLSIFICYFLCFFSASPLTQIGFWFSIYWGLNAIAGDEGVRREEEVVMKEEDELKKEEERGKKEVGGRKRRKEERIVGKKKEDEMKPNINEKITGTGGRIDGGKDGRRLEEGIEGDIGGGLNPNILRPRWLLYMSLLSLLMIWYMLVWEKESFKHLEEGRKKIMRTICHEEEILDMDVDFRYMGYFFCVLILNSLFPLFLYIQHKHLYNLFKTNSFTYKMVFQTFREDIGQERLSFTLEMYPYYIYFGMVLMLVFLGLRIKMAIVVIIPSFALQSYMGLIIKDRRIVWMIFFYVGSFFVLNATFLMDKQEDLLSIKFFGDFHDNFFLYSFHLLAKLMLIYYSMEAYIQKIIIRIPYFNFSMTTIYSLNDHVSIKEEEEEKEVDNYLKDDDSDNELTEEEFEIIFEFLWSVAKFILNYLFVIYLFIMADHEDSIILMGVYILFGMICFAKILLYSSLSRDETYRIVLSLAVFVAGIRIGIMEGKYSFPIYFSFFLTNFSVFSLYASLKTAFVHILSLLLHLSLFIFSFLLASRFGMLINLFNFSLFLAFLTADTPKMILSNLFFLLLGNIVIFGLMGFSMDFYFEGVEFIMRNVVPISGGTKWGGTWKGIGEKELLEGVMRTIQKWLLGS